MSHGHCMLKQQHHSIFTIIITVHEKQNSSANNYYSVYEKQNSMQY